MHRDCKAISDAWGNTAKDIKLMHTVYVLHSKKENKFYIGLTENIDRRLREHKTGYNRTTSRYEVLELIYLESYINKQDAMRRERYFKTTAGKRTLRLMLKETLSDYRCPVV